MILAWLRTLVVLVLVMALRPGQVQALSYVNLAEEPPRASPSPPPPPPPPPQPVVVAPPPAPPARPVVERPQIPPELREEPVVARRAPRVQERVQEDEEEPRPQRRRPVRRPAPIVEEPEEEEPASRPVASRQRNGAANGHARVVERLDLLKRQRDESSIPVARRLERGSRMPLPPEDETAPAARPSVPPVPVMPVVIPAPSPAAPPAETRRKEWATVGVYKMSWDPDIQSGDARVPVPTGGGHIEDVECGLGGPWSVGFSRISFNGDIPGYQSDFHVNYHLPDRWTLQLATSFGEAYQGPGGPLRNDFTGVSYSLIKSFRLTNRWRFQAGYSNLPIRDYQGVLTRPIKARAGYHTLTLSYSPSKNEHAARMSYDFGLMRMNDIRPIGFSYLFAGASYRFHVPRLLP